MPLRKPSLSSDKHLEENTCPGWAVHGTVCMLNHSWDANAALTQSPLGEMEIRAIKPISPGQEITISYIHVPDFPNKTERRKHLLTQYRFLCRCELCEKK